MHSNITALVAAVVAIATAIVVTDLLRRNRSGGPWWLVAAGVALTYPVSATLLDRVDDAPNGWLRLAFQVGCGVLLASLIGPWYRRLREHETHQPVSADRKAPPHGPASGGEPVPRKGWPDPGARPVTEPAAAAPPRRTSRPRTR
ncbi:hypothetical protein [Streptomyces sp. YS415]|uniref:hypothetical protein n=1 Tax=Streptomyces sp. YS415 TaxID=2944806 RepID=UPI0020228D70|nr:hypothetical protein [Streptomyces sp. YS415]MCL7429395.1 hypothetical protein [Streptomyces sp. YS415]